VEERNSVSRVECAILVSRKIAKMQRERNLRPGFEFACVCSFKATYAREKEREREKKSERESQFGHAVLYSVPLIVYVLSSGREGRVRSLKS
jgi:hypothetical protein